MLESQNTLSGDFLTLDSGTLTLCGIVIEQKEIKSPENWFPVVAVDLFFWDYIPQFFALRPLP